MKTSTKTRRAGAVVTSVAAVGLIIGGTWGVGAALAAQRDATAPAPTSTVATVPAAPYVNPDTIERQIAADREAERIEAERVAAEAAAAEAARVEAERVAAEQAEQAAPAEQAEQAAPAEPAPPAVEPAPAPAPAAPAEPGGNQQAGECREYNDANECTAYYVP